MTTINADQWKLFTKNYPQMSFLQSVAWGELKSSFGWRTEYICNSGCGVLVLFRSLPLGLSVAYIPRGPVGVATIAFWDEIHAVCRKNRAVYLRIEPDVWQGSAEAVQLAQTMKGFRPAYATVQPPRTALLSLDGSPQDWLMRMNEKTRYNVRLSQRKDMSVDFSNVDLEDFYRLMVLTGKRDRFPIHSFAYYTEFMQLFSQNAQLITVNYQGQVLSAMILLIQGETGIYLYGASSGAQRNRMPNHLLQWTAMNICAENGCRWYDLWGVPDVDAQVLERDFQSRTDGLWGVYRFKRGFGGEIKRKMGAYDAVYQPLIYHIATQWSKRK